MTTAVLFRNEEQVLIAADFTETKCGTKPYYSTEPQDKFIQFDQYVIAYSGYPKLAVAFQRVLEKRVLSPKDSYETELHEAVMEFYGSDNEEPVELSMLVYDSSSGRTFRVDGMGSVIEIERFASIGSGAMVAEVAFWALDIRCSNEERDDPRVDCSEYRVAMAMGAAEKFDLYSCKTVNHKNESYEMRSFKLGEKNAEEN